MANKKATFFNQSNVITVVVTVTEEELNRVLDVIAEAEFPSVSTGESRLPWQVVSIEDIHGITVPLNFNPYTYCTTEEVE